MHVTLALGNTRGWGIAQPGAAAAGQAGPERNCFARSKPKLQGTRRAENPSEIQEGRLEVKHTDGGGGGGTIAAFPLVLELRKT